MRATEIFKEKFKQGRVSSGMTVGRLAEELGIAERTVGRYEQGAILPPLDRLDSISKALGRPVAWFFTDDFGFKPEPRVRIRQISTKVRELMTELAQVEKEL